MNQSYLQSLNIEDTVLEIPAEITEFISIYGTYGASMQDKEIFHIDVLSHRYKKLYAVIYEEYTDLPIEEKRFVRSQKKELGATDNYGEYVSLSINFRSKGKDLSIRLCIDGKMPRSLEALKLYADGFPFDEEAS